MRSSNEFRGIATVDTCIAPCAANSPLYLPALRNQVTPSVGTLMPHELQGAAWLVGVMAMLALIVKHDRRVKRYLLKGRRRRKPANLRRPVLS